jgi:hypothetical protein
VITCIEEEGEEFKSVSVSVFCGAQEKEKSVVSNGMIRWFTLGSG